MTRNCKVRLAWALLVAGPWWLARADVTGYAVAKSAGFTQTSNLPPAGPDSFLFSAAVYYDIPDEVVSGTIGFDMPPFVTYDLYRATESAQLYVSSLYSFETDLDLNYPSTTYTLSTDGLAGLDSGDVFLPASLYPPEIPAFTQDTYDRLQNYDPALAFAGTVASFALAPGTTYGATYISVVEEGVGYVASYALTPDETAFELPADLLLPDTDYSIGVQYINGIESLNAGFGGAPAYAEFSSGTIVYFHTLPNVLDCPGDLDGSGAVDLADLSTLLSQFGASAGMTYSDGDLDGDGAVSLADLSILLAHFGEVCA